MPDSISVRTMLLQLFRQAAWAPIAVLLFHALMVRTPYRVQFDGVHHFLGGVTISYFLLKSVCIASPIIGSLRPVGTYLFAFALACAAAVFWEIAEFAADQFFGTHIQITLTETMGDLIFGVAGAASTLLLMALFQTFRLKNQP
ncbi:MAG: hypothetical protein V4772_09815 [Pseudomonadota bacterium]